ncbi:MAG: ribonuclease HI family protein [Thermoplasmata archaeon]
MRPEDEELPRGVVVSEKEPPVTVHFDGACQTVGRQRIAAYGCTIDGVGIDHEESGLAVPPGHPRATNNVAEYIGAIRALEWLAAVPYRGEVVVRGDSELVVRQMTGEYEVRAEHLKPYHERLKQLAGLFPHVEFEWIARDENRRADELSKEGIASVWVVAPGPARRRAEADEGSSDDPPD